MQYSHNAMFVRPPIREIKLGENKTHRNFPVNLIHCVGFDIFPHKIPTIKFIFARQELYWHFESEEQRDDVMGRLERVYGINL